jgi:hypothetical protein
MAKSTGNNAVLLALVVGGALYYLYQRQQALSAQYGVANDITGDIEQFSTNVVNTVENATIGTTRGERNNNPGNIRLTSPQTQWQGLSAIQQDGSFCQFTSPLYGIRAMHVNFNTYFEKYGLNTVQQIISRWAPAADHNNTAAYIANVCNSMGVSATQTLDLTNEQTMMALIHAVIMQENGSDPYLASGQLQQAVAMA